MNQPPASNSSNSSGNNSNRRRRRKPSGKKPTQAAGQNANQPNSPGPSKKSSNRSRRGLSLVEQHVEARRKYYDLFYRADPNQLRKLEREFTDSQAKVLAFEESLKPNDREEIIKDYGGKPEDRVYTQNHELPPEQIDVPTQGDFEDPHVLESQKAANFKDDTEETVGTIEDYNKLKGIV